MSLIRSRVGEAAGVWLDVGCGVGVFLEIAAAAGQRVILEASTPHLEDVVRLADRYGRVDRQSRCVMTQQQDPASAVGSPE